VLHVLFYTKDDCSLCDDAYALLKMLQREYSFTIEEINIHTDDQLLEKYQLLIPVLKVNDKELTCEQMSLDEMESAIVQALS